MSPDGKWLALTCPSNEDAKLKIVSVEDGEAREIYRFKEGIELGRVPSTTWTADGKYILFNMTDPEIDDENFELYRISVAGGEPEKLGLKMKNVFLNLDAHPNGKSITFSSSNRIINEIWVMENFLPETGAK
jgi:Tol biopolymer transport system component